MRVSVSTIIPCYRCADLVGRAMESVARQTVLPIEVILVDDGSGDDTLDTLYALQARYGEDWVKVIAFDRNLGVSIARNTAWDVAVGDYIAFLDADDVWHPEKIALQYGWMCEHPATMLSGHDYVLLDEGQPMPSVQIPRVLTAQSITRRRLLLSNLFTPSAVMIKRELHYRFVPLKHYCEDYLLWLELEFDGVELAALRTVLTFKTLGKNAASRNLLKMRSGDINNYWRLWRTGRLEFIRMSALVAYSLLKFLLLLIVGPRSHYAIKRWIERD